MNKTIRNLAIAALFVFPGLSGFPQEVQQDETPAAKRSQEAERKRPRVSYQRNKPIDTGVYPFFDRQNASHPDE